MDPVPANRKTPSATAKFVHGLGVTLIVALATYLAAVNALSPWDGPHLWPESTLSLVGSAILTVAAAATCVWRLATGEDASSEFRRWSEAAGGDDDSGGLIGSIGDLAD